jgi:hypothetical protein
MIEILNKISQNFFVFWPCRASSYKPPSARENNISSSLPLGSLGVGSLITSVYTYRGGGYHIIFSYKLSAPWSLQIRTIHAMLYMVKLIPKDFSRCMTRLYALAWNTAVVFMKCNLLNWFIDFQMVPQNSSMQL